MNKICKYHLIRRVKVEKKNYNILCKYNFKLKKKIVRLNIITHLSSI